LGYGRLKVERRRRRTEIISLNILGVGNMILDSRIDRIKLSPRLWVQEDIESFPDTLEERIVVGASDGRTGLLVRVVSEDFSSVGYSDMVFRGEVSEVTETEDGVVILFLQARGHVRYDNDKRECKRETIVIVHGSFSPSIP
jgi:hypothetical protein